MSTIAYTPSSDAAFIAQQKILAIYVCAYPTTPVSMQQQTSSGRKPGPAGPKTNHWVLFCATSNDESVRIDPSPSGINMSVVLGVTRKPYIYSRATVKVMRIVTKDLTAGALIQLIQSKTYDKYQFATSGQGCRYWVYSVLHLLNQSGFVATESEVNDVIAALGVVWAEDGTQSPAEEQTPITPGRFYALGN